MVCMKLVNGRNIPLYVTVWNADILSKFLDLFV